MYYNRSQNPARPEWITVRGSSKLEGYHPHLHACLPGTNYSPMLADAIITLFNFVWNYKRSVRNGGACDHNFYDLWLVEHMQQVCTSMQWDYELPEWQPAPATTDERFGLDFVPDSKLVANAEQEEALQKGTVLEAVSDEAQQLLSENILAAQCFLGEFRLPSIHQSTQQAGLCPQLYIQSLDADHKFHYKGVLVLSNKFCAA